MSWLTQAPKYLGLGAPSFEKWVAAIGGALGEKLSRKQRGMFEALFHRAPLSAACRELWLAVGRRGGKDFVCTRLAIYLALFRAWKLAPGEVGVVLLLAVDRAQSKVAYNYVKGALEADPVLWGEVANVTADVIVLRNGIEIQVSTSDFATVRGRTIVAALLDEFAFWPAERATEVLRALRPAQATQPDSMLIIFSSVYAMRGPFYDARRRYFGGSDPRVLFGVATTRDMNPNVTQEFVDGELARDFAAASAEYLSIERTDVVTFFDPVLVDGATRSSPREIPFSMMNLDGGHNSYGAGLDVSGGRGDACVAVIWLRVGLRVVICAMLRIPSPHDPLKAAHQVAAFLKTYQLETAMADQYGAEFVVSAYREAGVVLTPAPVTRTEAYLHLLPLFTTGRIEIPEDATLRTELLGLERRTGSSGRDIVDHAPHCHDDAANALAIAAYAASSPSATGPMVIWHAPSEIFDDYVNDDGASWRDYKPY